MTKLAVHKVLVNAPVATVWANLVDWQNWTKWDKGMQSIKFKEPLALNAKGRISLGRGLSCTLVVTEWDPINSYKSEFKLWGSRFIFDHHIESAATYTLVTFRVSVEGSWGEVLQPFLMAKFGEQLPGWMDNFKQLVEQQNADPATT